MTDLARVKKIYKLNAGTAGGDKSKNGVNGIGGRETDAKKELEVLIVGSMALRGMTN